MSQLLIPLCDYKTMIQTLNKDQACLMAKSAICSDEMKKINFHEFYFCWLNQNTVIFMVLTIICVYIIFRFISISIDQYVAPSITRLSNVMGLSSALSAVTLIALANGAGDVITAIVSSDSEGGVSYNIGALFGAGLFCTSLVIAITVIQSPVEIVVTNNVLYRDVVFFILATIYVLIAAIYGQITTLIAVFMIVMYLALVITVIIQDKYYPEAPSNKLIQDISNQDSKSSQNNDVEQQTEILSRPPIVKKTSGISKMQMVTKKLQFVKRVQKNTLMTHQEKRNLVHDIQVKKAQEEGKEEEQKSCLSKSLDIFDLPFDLIRKVTILPAEEEHFHHYLTYLWCIFGISFLILFTVGFNVTSIIVIIPLGLFFFLIFFLYQRKLSDKRAIPKCFTLMNILSIISGCFWAFIVIEILVDLMTTIGLICRLSNTFLGLTVLAIGNALPDALTTIVLAKNGQAITGIIGTYAGQLFGLLIGFGIAQIKTTLNDGPQTFNLFSEPAENLLDIVVVFMQLLTLVVTLLYGIFNNKVFDKKFGYILVSIYFVFFLTAWTVQIYQITQLN